MEISAFWFLEFKCWLWIVNPGSDDKAYIGDTVLRTPKIFFEVYWVYVNCKSNNELKIYIHVYQPYFHLFYDICNLQWMVRNGFLQLQSDDINKF